MKPHTEVTDAAVEATCTAKGKTEGKHCEVCDTILVPQTDVDAKGHKEVIDAAVAPDCVNTGLTEGIHCERCDEVLVAQETVDATDHNFGDWTVSKAPTVDAAGEKIRSCTNADCEEKETDVIPKLPKITEAPVEEWTKGSDDGLVFKSDANFSDFVSVSVDGVEISSDKYTVTEGSTIVILKADYLDSLEKGEHTISIKSTTGVAEATFEITNSAAIVIIIFIILAVVVIGGSVVAFFIINKKKAN